MRTSFLISFLLSSLVHFSFAQEWKYFECKKSNDYITLEYNIKKSDPDSDTFKTYPMYIQNQKKIVADIQGLLKAVFQNVTEDQKAILKQSSCMLWIDGGSARCERSYFRCPAEKMDELQLLEPQLFELIEKFMKWDFTAYDLYYSYPDKKELSVTNCGFPLFWIWK